MYWVVREMALLVDLTSCLWFNNRTGVAIDYVACHTTYQNQRFVFSWGPPALPTDRSEWTDEKGTANSGGT